ncbi:hypothetical protein [Allorhizocola rhizosphaerae]|uniref:hypothetical protein n=1 Tax=Allorhizocola rhizosphaerae TaxID=1872709 RepID=UPI000E3B9F74|nr:hypothetical protein [Allorhizocola rhizosphaerae]
MSSEQELQRMFGDAMAMPDSVVKMAALDAAIRHADAAGSQKLAFQFRHQAITPFHFAGDDRRAFLAFSQSLAAYDRDPTIAPNAEHSILWQFKWMVSALTEFPEIPLDRTYAVLADMQQRYQRAGYSLHPVHQRRCQLALHIGDFEQAARSYHDMVTAKRDGMSDCAVCVPSGQTRILSAMGRWEEALEAGHPARNGRCARQPQWVQAFLLQPYVRAGRVDEAAEMFRASYRRMREAHTYLGGIGLHLSFLAATGNEVRGLELIERHLPWLDVSHTPGDRMHFASAAVNVLRRLSDNGYGAQETARGSTVDELAASLRAYALELAAKFDARNGTDRQARLAEERMTAPRLVGDRVRLTVLSPGTKNGKEMLDAALAMKDQKQVEEALSAAEEAATALERAGESEDLWRARLLLWELYSRDYRHTEAALAVLELLLGNENLPERGKLAERGARMAWGEKAFPRWVVAADLYRAEGDGLSELRALRWAIATGGSVELLERADAIEGEQTAPWQEERGHLDIAAAGLLRRQGRPEAALARVSQASIARDDWLICSLLLELGRPAEAEALARETEQYDMLVPALRALGRHEEAKAVMDEQDLEEEDLHQ